jgi:hypothetical protein
MTLVGVVTGQRVGARNGLGPPLRPFSGEYGSQGR